MNLAPSTSFFISAGLVAAVFNMKLAPSLQSSLSLGEFWVTTLLQARPILMATLPCLTLPYLWGGCLHGRHQR